MNDTIIFLVLAGIALAFKWFSRQGGEAENSESPPAQSPNEPLARPPLTRAPAQSEEERVRRFLEALGAPPGSAPPPPVRPRATVPRPVLNPAPQSTRPKSKRAWAQPLPPLVTVPEEQPAFPPLVTKPEREPVLVVTAVPPAPTPLPSISPFVQPTHPIARTASAAMSLGEMLRRRGSAREAIILREVLGPPRGLQSFEGALLNAL